MMTHELSKALTLAGAYYAINCVGDVEDWVLLRRKLIGHPHRDARSRLVRVRVHALIRSQASWNGLESTSVLECRTTRLIG